MNTTPSDSTALRKSLTIAAIIMMGSVMLSRVFGLVREYVVAGFGGTGVPIDSYVTAFFIPELLNHFLAGGFLSVTFIPIFQKHLSASDDDGAWKSFSNLFTIGTLAFAIAIPVAMWLTPAILGHFGAHISKNEENFALTVRLTRIILPAQIMFYWGAFFSAVQMSRHRFFLPALAPLFYNIGIIAGGKILGPRLGVEGFAWGVLLGAFAANILIQLPGALRAGLRFRPRFDLKDPDFKKFVVLTIPLVVGMGMTFSNEIFFRYFGSHLGEGVLSSTNYALRTMLMVVAVFGQASGVAFFPYLSRYAVEKKIAEMTSLLNTMITRIALAAIPVSLLLIVLATRVIGIIYEHGRFTSESTDQTAPIFAVFLLGAFTFSAAMIVTRAFYAVQNTLLPMLTGTGVAIVSLPAYYFASRAWGAQGIAIAAVCGMTAQFIVLFFLWYRSFGDTKTFMSILRSLTVIVFICTAASVAAAAAQSCAAGIDLGMGVRVNRLVVCAISALTMTVVVAILYQTAGLYNVSGLLRRLARKTGVRGA